MGATKSSTGRSTVSTVPLEISAPVVLNEADLQISALRDVCGSYLDHLELIILQRERVPTAETIALLRSNVRSARKQLSRFNESLVRPHLLEMDRKMQDKKSGVALVEPTTDDAVDDLFERDYGADLRWDKAALKWQPFPSTAAVIKRLQMDDKLLVAVTPDNNSLLVFGIFGELKPKLTVARTISLHSAVCTAVRAPNTVCVAGDCTLAVYNLHTGAKATSDCKWRCPVSAVRFLSDTDILVCLRSGRLSVIDWGTGKRLFNWKPTDDGSGDVALCLDLCKVRRMRWLLAIGYTNALSVFLFQHATVTGTGKHPQHYELRELFSVRIDATPLRVALCPTTSVYSLVAVATANGCAVYKPFRDGLYMAHWRAADTLADICWLNTHALALCGTGNEALGLCSLFGRAQMQTFLAPFVGSDNFGAVITICKCITDMIGVHFVDSTIETGTKRMTCICAKPQFASDKTKPAAQNGLLIIGTANSQLHIVYL